MKILDWVFLAHRETQVLEFARRLSQEQEDRVWQQLVLRAGALESLPEARGYIRSRAQRILRSGLQRLVDPSDKLSQDFQDRIVEQAVDRMVEQFAAPLIRPAPVQAMLRRAA